MISAAYNALLWTLLVPAFSADYVTESELQESHCEFNNVKYTDGDVVKTGEPCLNCFCNYGSIVCHLRVCAPIPNPPPSGCFVLHRRNMCCPELICNDDNNIFNDLEARSKPGSIDLDMETNPSPEKGCFINGTTYAEGSALSSSTDCNYCYCMKGKEHCVKPNCVLQISGCTPVFSKHTCCPVKYTCENLKNVTIITTNTTTAPTIMKSTITSEHLNQPFSESQDPKSTLMNYKQHDRFSTRHFVESTSTGNKNFGTTFSKDSVLETVSDRSTENVTNILEQDVPNEDLAHLKNESKEEEQTETNPEIPSTQRDEPQADINTAGNDISTTERDKNGNNSYDTEEENLENLDEKLPNNQSNGFLKPSHSIFKVEDYILNPQNDDPNLESNKTDNDEMRTENSITKNDIITEPDSAQIHNHTAEDLTTYVQIEADNSTAETVTEISTTISLIKAELLLKEIIPSDTNGTMEERNAISNDVKLSDTVENTNATDAKSSSLMSPDIEAILNVTKKKPDTDYELDYDEPTLPPSLPNLKIIPFVAADALDKPKEPDAVLEHKEHTYITEEPDSLFIQPPEVNGQFSPPMKTEGGFVPKQPILDGPYFESKFDTTYQSTERNVDVMPDLEQSFPSITEQAKITEKKICTIGLITHRHGELVSEPKACNMCLCLYGKIVCQEPKCPPVEDGCQRIKNNENDSDCCGKMMCNNINEPTTIQQKDFSLASSSPIYSVESVHNTTEAERITSTQSYFTESSQIAFRPTYMTIKVTRGNHSTSSPKKTSTSTTVSHSTNISKNAYTSNSDSYKIVTTASSTHSSEVTKDTPTPVMKTTQKVPTDADYEGFSFDKVWSFLFDEPPVVKTVRNKTTSTEKPLLKIEKTTKVATVTTTLLPTTSPTPGITFTTTKSTSTTGTTSAPTTTSASTVPTSTSIITQNITSSTTSITTTEALKQTDSAVYMIKNENPPPSFNVIKEDIPNTIKHVNSYYVPPLGNYEEMIVNPTKSAFITKKPVRKNPLFPTTPRPWFTTNRLIPLSGPTTTEKAVQPVLSVDSGAGFLKLSGCNIFGKMYKIGKIISELSSPCLQCVCADVGVHCTPLDC